MNNNSYSTNLPFKSHYFKSSCFQISWSLFLTNYASNLNVLKIMYYLLRAYKSSAVYFSSIIFLYVIKYLLLCSIMVFSMHNSPKFRGYNGAHCVL